MFLIMDGPVDLKWLAGSITLNYSQLFPSHQLPDAEFLALETMPMPFAPLFYNLLSVKVRLEIYHRFILTSLNLI